jgi:small subunit ribosomal protein S20
MVASGDAAAARAALPATLGLIERTAQKGVIHRNTADRYKSRLSKLVRDVKNP